MVISASWFPHKNTNLLQKGTEIQSRARGSNNVNPLRRGIMFNSSILGSESSKSQQYYIRQSYLVNNYYIFRSKLNILPTSKFPVCQFVQCSYLGTQNLVKGLCHRDDHMLKGPMVSKFPVTVGHEATGEN